MANQIKIGFLTSVYGRASDTFLRIEVTALRSFGHSVQTYSIRRPAASELINDEIRREQAATEAVLDVNLFRMAASALGLAIRSPKRMLRAILLTKRICWPGLKGHLWPIVYFLEAAYLAERMRAKEIEHLHNHLGENSASVAMLASAMIGIPFSMTIHGPSEFDRPTELALDVKIHQAAFVVSITEFTRSQLFRWSNMADWPKIHIVRSGIEARFLDRELDLPPDVPNFVNIGRLAEPKGQLLLVEAAGILASEGIDFQVTLIGDGPMRRPIEDAIKRLGLESRVRLAGWKSPDEIRDEILRSRAVVLPSFAEGLPMVIMEAFALGRPTISTYIAGIPELVETGTCGWLIPAGSVSDLAKVMREALSASVEELGRLGLEGARRVAERHDIRIEGRKLEALIVAGSSC